MRGVITRIVDDGGAGRAARTFGFIKGEDGVDRFFHKKDLRGPEGLPQPSAFGAGLEGRAVTFDEFKASGDARARATNVFPIAGRK